MLVDYLLIIFSFVFGLSIGSFMNAAEYRLATGRSLFLTGEGEAERSICPHCSKTLLARDLIPLFSYMVLRGRCRFCGKRISLQYPLVELVTAGVFALSAFEFGWSVQMATAIITGAILVFLFLYDYKHHQLPDVVILPAIVLAFLFGLVNGMTILNMVTGAVIAGFFFWFQYIVSNGKWIGDGDIRLGILMGLLLGWQATILALFLAYVGGALIASAMLLRKQAGMKTRIAFGTFLSVATFVSLLYGDTMIDWYLGLLV
ncbi:MAG: prepilin peptidase [Candidatus Kerfeldbacteria bacterium]